MQYKYAVVKNLYCTTVHFTYWEQQKHATKSLTHSKRTYSPIYFIHSTRWLYCVEWTHYRIFL